MDDAEFENHDPEAKMEPFRLINRLIKFKIFTLIFNMEVYGLQIPNKSLPNLDLMKYADDLSISNFRGVFMRDELPKIPRLQECGIVNFNTSSEPGSHWVAY